MAPSPPTPCLTADELAVAALCDILIAEVDAIRANGPVSDPDLRRALAKRQEWRLRKLRRMRQLRDQVLTDAMQGRRAPPPEWMMCGSGAAMVWAVACPLPLVSAVAVPPSSPAPLAASAPRPVHPREWLRSVECGDISLPTALYHLQLSIPPQCPDVLHLLDPGNDCPGVRRVRIRVAEYSVPHVNAHLDVLRAGGEGGLSVLRGVCAVLHLFCQAACLGLGVGRNM